MAEMTGMNYNSYDEMLLKIYKIKEDLNITFNNINSSVDSLSDCYKSEVGKAFIESFKDFSNANFNTTLENIDTYIKDLKNAKENIQLFETKLSAQILDDTFIN